MPLLRCILCMAIMIHGSMFAQSSVTDVNNKINIRNTVDHYLENTSLSRHFVKTYVKLMTGPKRYATKARILIQKLYSKNDLAFYRLMRIKLEWEYIQHLKYTPLDSVRSILQTNKDSAHYYYTLALYFTDSMNATAARKFGYVKAINPSVEEVDWIKMKSIKWADPKIIQNITGHERFSWDEKMRDTAFAYYKRAIEQYPAAFFYLKETIFFLHKIGERKLITELISQQQHHYTKKEKEWLNDFILAINK